MILLSAHGVELEVLCEGFSVTFGFCRLKTFRFALKFSTEIFTPYKLFLSQSGLSEFMVSSQKNCCTICNWEYELFSLCSVFTSFALVHLCLLPKYILPKFTPRLSQFPGILQLELSFQICLSLAWSHAEFGKMFNHCSKRNHWTFEWLPESPFIWSFHICQEVLDISQIAIAFHRISRPFFIQA